MSVDQHLRHAVCDRALFQGFKKRFDPRDPVRHAITDWDALRQQMTQRDYRLVIYARCSTSGWLRDWIAMENVAMGLHDDPAWVEETMELA